MSLRKKLAVGGAGAVAILLIFIAIVCIAAAAWGWIFMVIAGAAGWHISYGTGFLIGIGITLVIGALKGD